MTYELSLSVAEGPEVSANNHFEAEAYEKIEALIPKGSVPTTVKVQPGALTELKAMIITAQSYADLTFTVDADVTVHTLDAPLPLIGAGNIGLLGATVNDLIFTNANAETDNMVTILVARTAIEPGA